MKSAVIALILAAQSPGSAADEPAMPGPTYEQSEKCYEQHGDSYEVFTCLGENPGFTEAVYERCNRAIEAGFDKIDDDDDASVSLDLQREYYDCLGVFTAQFSPIDEVVARIPELHPLDYYTAATRLFQEADRQEEALFWFYAGQLRWRTRLECHPPEPGGEGALFGAMNAMVGEELNAYAAKNVDLWLTTIDQVIAWDQANPEPYLTEIAPGCATTLESQRSGMRELQDHIRENRAELETSEGETFEP